MAKPSRAKILLLPVQRTTGTWGWEIRRGTRVIAASKESYARKDALRRSMRHLIKQIAPQVGATVTLTSSR